MSDVVYLGLVVEGGENMTAVQVIEGQVSLPRVDKVHKLPPSEDVEGSVVTPLRGRFQHAATTVLRASVSADTSPTPDAGCGGRRRWAA